MYPLYRPIEKRQEQNTTMRIILHLLMNYITNMIFCFLFVLLFCGTDRAVNLLGLVVIFLNRVVALPSLVVNMVIGVVKWVIMVNL